ncbi:protein phosphatase 1 regulatory subunit 12B isoform X2 [Cyprinus carpio]|uniref:Protein phosphatase 1 regulatory subunit 12B isoform X2 n=1 Tax=Cyprinus carpio TaxID=7962 RepID=A0A9R0AP29_CYPCA|nr:protein phosphatase 1 regulatory subunit 12B isoform X2 [Cyprinus carpio]
MQDCLLRTRMIPVRDEEAESQRKAKSRQARQTRRATQGVTLSEMLEAKRAFSPSNRRVPEDTTETSPALREEQLSDKHPCEHLDKQGNWKRRPRSKPERSSFSLSSSVKGACGFTPSLRSRSTCIESECTDENDNILHGSSDASLTQQLTEDRDLSAELTQQDRASRSDSSGVESPSDRLSARTSTYTRRENRLASLSKTEDDSASKDYKKLYEDALTENEKLKSRLQDSKQELTKIRSQLDRVTQKQDRISERSSVFESEKREKEALEKRVSNMEEELKVLTELKSDNQRLKDENGALIRVISKLSK